MTKSCYFFFWKNKKRKTFSYYLLTWLTSKSLSGLLGHFWQKEISKTRPYLTRLATANDNFDCGVEPDTLANPSFAFHITRAEFSANLASISSVCERKRKVCMPAGIRARCQLIGHGVEPSKGYPSKLSKSPVNYTVYLPTTFCQRHYDN